MKYKKGYTLIELLVALFISTILLTVIFKILTTGYNEYLVNSTENIINNNLDNCLLNLDNLFRSSYIEKIEGYDNKLVITMKVDNESAMIKRKIIFLKDTNLMVSTYNNTGYDITSGDNVLLRDVAKFEVVKKENLIYFEISMKNGVTRIKCV